MIEVGRLCLKTAGRDAGKICVVVEILEKNYVMVDGEVRRKKCNITHLEPLDKKLDIKSKAAHAEITKKLREIGIEVKEKKPKPKKEKLKKLRKKEKLAEEKTEEKKDKEKNANLDRKI